MKCAEVVMNIILLIRILLILSLYFITDAHMAEHVMHVIEILKELDENTDVTFLEYYKYYRKEPNNGFISLNLREETEETSSRDTQQAYN